MLYEMYLKYIERKGWTTVLLDKNENGNGGYRSITIEIHGKNAYGTLKNESGVHRLVRMSPFNAKGKRNTSFSMIEVLPKFEKTEFEIPETELEMVFSKSGGKGGQNVNKRETCDLLIDIGAGTSPDAIDRALALAEKYERVYFTAGIHPHDAATLGSQSSVLETIEKAIQHPKCVAIGECGLDYHYQHSPRDEQIKIFQWHIDLATRSKLPLMIHTRDAEEDTKNLLTPYQGDALFHCFTGTQDLANFGVSKNFYISFSGIVTFKKADELRAVFMKVPLENILIETDSPYLAPMPMRGKRCESAFVKHTAEFLARSRMLSLNDFAKQMRSNARRIFKKVDPQLIA
jgi:TatD DNase family protein